MKPTLVVKSARRSCSDSAIQRKAIKKSKNKYKQYLVRVLLWAQRTTRQQLWSLDTLTREGAHSDGFPLMASEAKPQRAITSPEVCSALQALHLDGAAKC